MICLSKFSFYETEAMERWLSAQREKGLEYTGRFLCFLHFKRTENQHLSAKIIYDYSSKLHIIYKDLSVQTEPVPFQEKLKNEIELCLFFSIVLFGCAFLRSVLSPVFGIDTSRAYWQFLVLVSLVYFPICIVSFTMLIHCYRKLKAICKYEKQKTEYRAVPRTSLYLAAAVAILLVILQSILIFAQKDKTKNITDQYSSYMAVLLADCGADLFETEWRLIDGEVQDTSIRLDYHRCRLSFVADGYEKQLERENTDSKITVTEENGYTIWVAKDYVCVLYKNGKTVTILSLRGENAIEVFQELCKRPLCF